MSHRLDLDRPNASVRLIFSGEVSLKGLQQGRAEAAKALRAQGWRRLLVDIRGIVPRFTLDETYALTAGHAGAFPPATRVAVVAPPGRLSEFADFSVTVARNRGFSMQAFGDAEAAIRWLDA